MNAGIILKMPDGGAYNAETVPGRFPVEPLNALTNTLFLLLVVYWLRKTWFNLAKHPLITLLMPVLLLATIGGVGHHLFRNDRLWHDIDMLGIFFAVILACVFFWYRATHSWILSFCLTLIYPLAMRAVLFNASATDRISVFIVFTAMALWVFIPAIIHCLKKKLSHIGYLAAAAFVFTLAMICRQVDMGAKEYFDSGTHFLWHIM
ncbi:MAG: hypothetical protein KAG97_07520, partial [Victivallales bacterium]|nr:hypothetical protein [Victivallales bacterium]